MTDVKAPAYRYGFLVTAIYDGDTIVGDVDLYKGIWQKDEIIRLYGINTQEIKRSRAKGIGSKDVQVGYDHRDALITYLGLNPADYPRKVKYHKLAKPIWVVIETIKDKSGKYGRLLGILHKDSVNINEAMRDVIGGVEFYDRKEYPSDHPIVAP